MYTKINGETYEVSTNLGTAYELEKKFNKKVADIATAINDFDIKQTVDVLYVGFKKKNPTVSEKDFESMLMDGDDLGIIDLKKEVLVLLTLIMSKNKSEEQVRTELEEKFNKTVEEAEAEEQEPKN